MKEVTQEFEGGQDDKYLIPSLVSACEILKFLSRYKTRKSTLTEISKNLQINKSTCYRLLHTLTRMKMVMYDPDTKMFSLGPQLVILGTRAAELIDYMPIAREYLKKAVRLTNCTCALVQRIENEWVYLAKEEAASPIRVTISVGQSFHIPNGATGKLFLAYMEESDQEKVFARLNSIKQGNRPINDPEALRRELRAIRERGYSYSLEEHYPGIDGVSAPVMDRSGYVQMAITAIMIHTEQAAETVLKIGEILKTLTSDLARDIYTS